MPKNLTHLFSRYPVILWVRLFGEWLSEMSRSMITPFLILYLHEKIGGSVPLVMLVIGLQPASDILFTLIAGGVTDRYGRKPVMLIALIIQALSMLGMALAGSLFAFAFLYILNGIGRSMFIPASRAVLADSMSSRQLSEAFALLSTATYIGASIGPLIGVMIYQTAPGLAFLFTALSLLLYAAVIWWKVPETNKPQPLETESTPANEQHFSLATLGRHRAVLSMLVLALPISLFYAQSETNLQLHLKEGFANYLEVLAWLALVKSIAAILFEYGLVRITSHLNPRHLIVFSYLCFALVSWVYGNATSIALLLGMQLVLVMGESIGLNHMLTLVSRIAPATMRGRYFAIYGLHWDISRTLGPLAGSMILLHFNGTILFSGVAVLLLIGALAQHLFLGRIEKASPAIREGSGL
ncbi:MFS transporter [Brevibacillus ruminantium]|uniref:MFS transporter n=1 Tax=Brevibacillus ruminantium TaxID=2950604 RepID=A0ABY4WJM3_9BACL|nr:MFS transporter [Brevibacillus ruminantium]USG67302.1 MFS transporter [Brevibacillus ruminantium]